MHGKFGGDSIMAVQCGSPWVEERLSVILHHNHVFANYPIFKWLKGTACRQITEGCIWCSGSMFFDSLTLLHDGIDILYLPDLSHACNPFHSSRPLPLVLVAVINISQVYESYLAFVPVEKQTARRLSRGAICVPLFSGVCRASRANASRCPLSFLSTISTNGAETFEGHNEIRSISSCPCGASKAQESAINIFERGQCPIISFHSVGYIITVIPPPPPPDLCCWEGITTYIFMIL